MGHLCPSPGREYRAPAAARRRRKRGGAESALGSIAGACVVVLVIKKAVVADQACGCSAGLITEVCWCKDPRTRLCDGGKRVTHADRKHAGVLQPRCGIF